MHSHNRHGEVSRLNIDKELTRGSISVMVMSLLERKEMYGYEIIKETEALSQGVFQFKEGTLYPVLHGLEANNLVESYWSEGDTGRRRKYYRLTREGRANLILKRREWATFTRAVSNVLGGAVQ